MLGDGGGLELAKRSRKSQAQRGLSITANDFASLLRPASLLGPVNRLAIEDRRLWSPLSVRPARSLRGVVRIGQFKKVGRPKGRLLPGFRFPSNRDVMVCVRRKERKQVLHAKGVAGRKGMRFRRRNEFSSVRC